MTKKYSIIISLTIVIVAVLITGYFKSTAFMQQTAVNIADNLTQKLGVTLKIDKIEISGFNKVKLSKVLIYDKSNQELADSEEIGISFSYLNLFRNLSFTESITEVLLSKPNFSLKQNKEGVWNFKDLISPDKSSDEDFYGKVKIVKGKATITVPEKTIFFDNINGLVDFITIKNYDIDLALTTEESMVTVAGNWGQDNTLKVNINNGKIENYTAFIPQNNDFKIINGNINNLQLTITGSNDEFKVQGMTEFNKVTATYKDYAINDIAGYLIFDNNKMRVYSSGAINQQLVGVSGEIDFQDELNLNLKVKSNNFDLTKIKQDFVTAGKVDFELFVFGSVQKPQLSGDVTINNLAIQGRTFNKIMLDLSYKDDLVTIHHGTILQGNGKVTANGNYNIKTQDFNISAVGKNMAVENLTQAVSGKADFNITMAGKNLAEALIYGNVELKDGQYNNVQFKKVEASFYKKGSDYIVNYLNIALPQGQASLSGKMLHNNLAFTMYGNKIPLELMKNYNEKIEISGNADVFAQISGTIDNPEIKLELAAENGSFYNQPFALLTGTIKLVQNKLLIDEFVLESGVTKHEITGSVTLEDNPAIDLKIKTQKARAENLIQVLMPGVPLTGNVDNEIVVAGTLDDIVLGGEITLTEGSYNKLLLSKVKSKYRIKDKIIFVENCEINAPNLQVNLQGNIDAAKNLNFNIVANNIDLARLNLNLPYPVSGIAKFNGAVTGTVGNPHFIGKIEAPELVFNEQKINNVNGDFEFVNQIIKVKNFGFVQGSGQYDFTANINLNNNKINGAVDVKNAKLNPLLAMFNLKQDWLDGDLNGQITIGGFTDNPQVWLKGNVRNGNIKNYSLDTIDVDISFANNIVSINEFTATQAQGVLLAKGSIVLGGDLNVEIAGNNIDAGLIEVFTKTNLGVHGNLNFATQISGNESSPKANISVEIKNGGIGKTMFDSLFGMIILENDMLQVDQMLLTKGEYKASAYGIVPLAALTKPDENLTVAQQMNLKIKLDHADLSILPVLSDDVSYAFGATKGNINITGTLNNILVNGSVKIDNGTVKLKYLEEAINNLTLDLNFNDDKINLETFSGELGSGYIKLTGFSKIKGFSLTDYNFDLQLASPVLTSKYFQGPLQGQLKLSQEKNSPKISGKLLFENCTIDIPMLDEAKDKMPLIRFDIMLDIGKKTRLYNSYLYDLWINGNVNIGGSTRWPKVTGTVNCLRGNVNYLRTVFRIREASAIFNQVGTFMPSLHLEAITKIDRTNISLKINGPVGANNFTLSSSPEMSQQEILSLLTLRSRYFNKINSGSDNGQSNNELTTLIGLGFQVGILSGVENEIRKGLGLDEFQLVRDTISEKADDKNNKVDQEIYNLEFGKYISDKVLLKYTMGVDYEHYAMGVRYDFDNTFSITADIDQDNKSKIGLEKRFKF